MHKDGKSLGTLASVQVGDTLASTSKRTKNNVTDTTVELQVLHEHKTAGDESPHWGEEPLNTALQTYNIAQYAEKVSMRWAVLDFTYRVQR